MSIVNTLSLESNRQIKINFDGGDLSSDAGLLLIKEFVSKLGIDKLFSHSFKTNDSASFTNSTKAARAGFTDQASGREETPKSVCLLQKAAPGYR